jgi:hypothetical protein
MKTRTLSKSGLEVSGLFFDMAEVRSMART